MKRKILRVINLALFAALVLLCSQYFPEITGIVLLVLGAGYTLMAIGSLYEKVERRPLKWFLIFLMLLPLSPIWILMVGFATVKAIAKHFLMKNERFRRWMMQRMIDKSMHELHDHEYLVKLREAFGTEKGPVPKIEIDDIVTPHDPIGYAQWRERRLAKREKLVKAGCTLEDCGSDWGGCPVKMIPGPKLVVAGDWTFRHFDKEDDRLGPYAQGTCLEHARLDMQAYVDEHKAEGWRRRKPPPAEAMEKLGVVL